MNARTIRRAIERKQARKAQKQSRKDTEARTMAASSTGSLSSGYTGQNNLTNQTFEEEPAHHTFEEEPANQTFGKPASLQQPSEARLNANRRNAQFSTGPNTEQGKSISSCNALRTALTGRTVLLPTDDADRYATHLAAFFHELSPKGQRETILTQSLADADWRIERVAGFEMALYAKGRALFADTHQHEPATLRAHLIELDVYQYYERELRNLHLQEGRLRRQRDRDNQELRRLQAERHAAAQQQLELAAQACQQAKEQGKSFDPTSLGFVFSTAQIERFLAASRPAPPSFKRPKAA